MQNLIFPIQFSFKVTSLANDFVAKDASGAMVAYVRQKMFKFVEDIEVFADESRLKVNYRIKADRWIDFSAAYAFFDETSGQEIGKIARKGWRSLWKAEYHIIDQNEQLQYTVREENGWVKVLDGLLGEIPILSFFTGYLFNPSYIVKNTRDQDVARISKQPSFWGKEFTVEKVGMMDQDDDDRIMLGLMMMVLLERRRG